MPESPYLTYWQLTFASMDSSTLQGVTVLRAAARRQHIAVLPLFTSSSTGLAQQPRHGAEGLARHFADRAHAEDRLLDAEAVQDADSFVDGVDFHDINCTLCNKLLIYAIYIGDNRPCQTVSVRSRKICRQR